MGVDSVFKRELHIIPTSPTNQKSIAESQSLKISLLTIIFLVSPYVIGTSQYSNTLVSLLLYQCICTPYSTFMARALATEIVQKSQYGTHNITSLHHHNTISAQPLRSHCVNHCVFLAPPWVWVLLRRALLRKLISTIWLHVLSSKILVASCE